MADQWRLRRPLCCHVCCCCCCWMSELKIKEAEEQKSGAGRDKKQCRKRVGGFLHGVAAGVGTCRGPPLPPRRRALKPHSPHPVQLTALVKCACVSRRPKGLYRRLEGRQKEAVELRAPLGVAKQLCKTSQSTFLRANS